MLVLIPGYGAGAGLFRATARDLVSNSADLQVWLPERREQNLIVAGNSSSKHGCSIATANPSSWGLKATLGDLRRVIAEASNHGRRRVVLGGHSWGATEALTYAAWDFDGRAGYRDLAGLLLIDGGVHDSFAGEGIRYRLTQEQAALRLKEIKSDSPFDNILSQLVGSNAPEAAGRTYKAAAEAALRDPDGRSVLADRLPAPIAPKIPVTNGALLGWLFDAGAPVPDVKLHLGGFSNAGNVQGWIAADRRMFRDFALAAAGTHPFAWEWYWPKRLSLDLEAADAFTDTPAASLLNLRISHAREIDVPLYVFQTGLTKGSVIASAKWLVKNSRIRQAAYEGDPEMRHLDPLFMVVGHNRFIETAVPFLEQVSGRRANRIQTKFK